MDPITQKLFDEIVKKDVSGLFPTEIIFLRARRSYLNYEQQQRFASVLDKLEMIVKPSPEVPGTLISAMTFRQLQMKAKELGLKYKIGITKEALYKLIDDYYVI